MAVTDTASAAIGDRIPGHPVLSAAQFGVIPGHPVLSQDGDDYQGDNGQ
jgi:hypothetical protein